ncbi:DUF2490 domain-containing protein [Mucilaginibacter segetis]|uniref:DUF2490 domain-containing protein n=1 Tax=Mucilaginibacter segetis TaxID=2793071 RepID=A0A934UN90_9SPHI|nr:DUF2490 domain-containing protein [Mucilaginibacter segetis]MBK0380184.1 DUF2490 domain-containing protein [Mucilaginibacter segetis]
MIKRFLLLLLTPTLCFSQSRNEFWGKLNIKHTIEKKWSVNLDVQYRSQQNPYNNNDNLFSNYLTGAARLTVNYQFKNEWQLVIIPIAWFNSSEIKNSESDHSNADEIRTGGGFIKGFKIGNVINKNRFLVEWRSLNYNIPQNYLQQRFRLQNNFKFTLGTSPQKTYEFNYLLGNEFMVKHQHKSFSVDQNRILNSLQLAWNKNDINLGYQLTIQNGRTGNINRNQLLLTYGIDL